MTDQTAGSQPKTRAFDRYLAALVALIRQLASALASRWSPPVLLPGYTIPRTSLSHRLARVSGYLLVGLFCVVYGAAFAVFTPALILAVLVPLVVLAVLAVWALPAMKVTPVRTLSGLFVFFTISIALWPNYLAIALPGLPWVTLQRLADGPMVLVLLLCLKSKDFTQRLGEILHAERPIWIALCIFVLIQVVSVGFSSQPFQSVSKLLVLSADCTATFFVAAFIFARKGWATRWAFLLWGLEVVQAFIVAWESRVQHVLWRDHIPSFLAIQDATVQAILSNGVLAYEGRYRAYGTFDGPIQLGEFTTLCFAFVVHFAMSGTTPRIRLLARISAPVLVGLSLLSGSRSGAVGLIGTILMYAFFFSVRRWRRDNRSLLAPLLALGYPIGAAAMVLATFFVGRLRAAVWGNNAVQQASTQARYEQISAGMPKVIKHPWGYGISRAAEVVGWVSPGGEPSIDSFYLTVVVEYGIQGFITFIFLFVYSMLKAAWYAIEVKSRDPELELLVPATVAIGNFLVVKSVFSQQDNHPLFFAVLGLIVALIYRAKLEAPARDPNKQGDSATPRRGLPPALAASS
jgi:O-Antigen ligase